VELSMRKDRFFNAVAPNLSMPSPLVSAKSDGETIVSKPDVHVISATSILPMSHYGFVYSLCIGALPGSSNQNVLFSGAGDGLIKVCF
jgi:hypothetical protein